MNIIIDNNNLIVWYGSSLPTESNNVFKDGNFYLGLATDSHTLIEEIETIEHYVPNTYSYIDGEIAITNQENYNSYVGSYNQSQRLKRAEAYKNESDQLFFKAQRQEIPMQEWLDKVSALKTKFSYIE
jgi:hypothetical protein